MKSHLFPLSLLGLVPATLLAGLSTIPQTSFLVALLNGAAAFALLVNASLAALALEALVGRVHRGWLLLPLLWFGGYAIAYLQSMNQFNGFEQQLRALNEGKAVAFDAAAADLVIEKDRGQFGPRLAADYRLNSFFSSTPESAEAAANGASANRYDRLELALRVACDAVKPETFATDHRFTYQLYQADGVWVKDACLVGKPGEPRESRITISYESDVPGDWPAGFAVSRITVAPAGSSAVELYHGTGTRLPLIPFPEAGCVPDVQDGRLHCRLGFSRETGVDMRDDAGQPMKIHDVLARALGLAKVPASQRIAEVPASNQ